MKTIIKLLLILGLITAAFLYRHDLARAINKLKRPTPVETQVPGVAPAVLVETNSPEIVATAPTGSRDRLDQIVGKMTASLDQLEKTADVKTPPVEVQPPSQAPTPPQAVEGTSDKYSRLWDKLQRNQNTINRQP